MKPSQKTRMTPQLLKQAKATGMNAELLSDSIARIHVAESKYKRSKTSLVKQLGLGAKLKSLLNRIEPLPGAPAGGFKFIDPVQEETKELLKQELVSKLTRGLSNRPNFHIQDRLFGGAIGGTASGYADHNLREHSGSGTDIAGRLAAVLGGGLLGGKGLNASMNVGRRYIAETSPLFGYSIPTNNKPFADKLKDLWRFGVKGEQRTDYIDKFDNAVSEAVAQGRTISGDAAIRLRQNREMGRARHELLRRYLGIHTDDVSKDIFKRTGDGSYRYNTQVMRPGNDTYQALVAEPTHLIGMENAMNPNRYSSDASKNMYAAAFGSHDMRLDRGLYPRNGGLAADYTVGDVWNFAIDPHEKDLKQYALGLAKTSPLRWKDYLSQRVSSATHPSMVETGTSTVGSRLGSGMLRSTMEKVFRHHTPVVRQPMTMQFAPAQQMERVMYPRPYALPSDAGRRPMVEKVFDIQLGE
jgi:hypothetical protein